MQNIYFYLVCLFSSTSLNTNPTFSRGEDSFVINKKKVFQAFNASSYHSLLSFITSKYHFEITFLTSVNRNLYLLSNLGYD